jgi:hypothetical protein
MTRGYVDDTETPVTKTNSAVNKNSCIIRPAMLNNITHPLNNFSAQLAT